MGVKGLLWYMVAACEQHDWRAEASTSVQRRLRTTIRVSSDRQDWQQCATIQPTISESLSLGGLGSPLHQFSAALPRFHRCQSCRQIARTTISDSQYQTPSLLPVRAPIR